MPILYAAVTQGSTVLSSNAICEGNFTHVAKQVLSRASPEIPKITYIINSYLFHCMSENEVVYLCITDDGFERSAAFSFLVEIKLRCNTLFTSGIRQSDFLNNRLAQILAEQMGVFNVRISDDVNLCQAPREEQTSIDLSRIVLRQLNMPTNIQICTTSDDDERMELKVNRSTDSLLDSIRVRTANHSWRHVLRRNAGVLTVAAVIILGMIYVAVSLVCGFDLKECSATSKVTKLPAQHF